MAEARPLPLDPLAPEETPEAQTGTGSGSRGLRAAVAVMALVFFAAPAVAWLLGAGGHRIEGERAVRQPSLSEGWDVFDTAARYFAAQLPGRERALRSNNFISKDVLGATPTYGASASGPDRALPFGGVKEDEEQDAAQNGGAAAGRPPVFLGLHGWSFLQADLDRACHRPIGLKVALRRWGELVREIRSSGRRVVLLVVPEKSTIYPENLGPRAIDGRCALHNKALMWSKVESLRGRGIVGLRRRLAFLKRSTGHQLYLSIDSHWNDLGGIELVRRALRAVSRQVRVRRDELVRGTTRYAGDVTRFSGEVRYATTPTIKIDRGGGDTPLATEVRRRGGATVLVSRDSPATAAVLPGTTLFLHDSFGELSPLPMLQHYAARLESAGWLELRANDLSSLVRGADTVILEIVERSFWQLPSDLPASQGGSLLTPEVLAKVRRALGVER